MTARQKAVWTCIMRHMTGGQTMKKILIAALMLSILLTGCANAYDAGASDTYTSDTVADTIATTSVTTTSEAVTTTVTTAQSEVQSETWRGLTGDYLTLEDMGLLRLINLNQVWEGIFAYSFLFPDYSAEPDGDYYPALVNDYGIPYMKALGYDLTADITNDDGAMLAENPLHSKDDIRTALKNHYSDDYIEQYFNGKYLNNDTYFTEHDGKLYMNLGVAMPPVCSADLYTVKIISQSDEKVVVSLTAVYPVGEKTEVKYSFEKFGDIWKIGDISLHS